MQIFFFNDTATTEIYTLSLHDALPICRRRQRYRHSVEQRHDLVRSRTRTRQFDPTSQADPDRKSTRLNSSHSQISYAVFCLKKKKIVNIINTAASPMYSALERTGRASN